jgi:hypothetical protein
MTARIEAVKMRHARLLAEYSWNQGGYEKRHHLERLLRQAEREMEDLAMPDL